MVTTGTLPLPSAAPGVGFLGSPSTEPGRSQRHTRPRNQYWDVMTASWQTAAVIPAPRRGD